jgi:hypothetical protein
LKSIGSFCKEGEISYRLRQTAFRASIKRTEFQKAEKKRAVFCPSFFQKGFDELFSSKEKFIKPLLGIGATMCFSCHGGFVTPKSNLRRGTHKFCGMQTTLNRVAHKVKMARHCLHHFADKTSNPLAV